MSGVFGETKRTRSRSPMDDFAKKSLLAKVTKSELKLLRVAVKRGDVIGGGPHLPLERSIDDPARICTYVHYRKDESKRLQPPIFGRGIKINQDFTENRRVFTHEKNYKDTRSSRKSRSRSNYRSRSPRSRTRSSSRSKKAKSQERARNKRSGRSSSLQRSRSRRKRTSSKKDSSRRSVSKHRSSSRERRYSSERRRYKDDSHHYSSQRRLRSKSQSHGPDPDCPVHGDRNHQKKSLTPLRPGEYRPGHPDLALRNKRQRSRSRSRSYDDRSRSKKSRSRDDAPSTSRYRLSPGRHAGNSKSTRGYRSPIRSDKKEHHSKSRSPIKSDRYRRRSRSPYNSYTSSKRPYKGDRNRSPRRRSRSPQYGEVIHGEYGYYEGWGPGPRLPAGRGGFPIPPYYAPGFHPRGMIPGPLIPPGHMIIPRIPIMSPYGPYRPHLPIYNSGAVRQRGPRPNVKPSSTITSEKDKDSESAESRVVITEVNSRESENNEENVQPEKMENSRDNDGCQKTGDSEEKK